MDAKMKGIVRVVPYDSQWKYEFLKIKEMIMNCIGDLIIGIEHVGSTAIEGLASKPIIDFIVIINSYEIFPLIVKKIETIGFEHEGDLGVKGREAFKRKFMDELMPYHMYVCPRNSIQLQRQIAFRDYLQTHKEDMQTYGKLKIQLAEKHRNDIDGYVKGKHDFVASILEKAKLED